jgi:RimJ/RimL family protein N-acetyltransferase
MLLETERCYLREFKKEDALSFFKMNNDFEVLKYTGDTSFQSVEDVALFIQNYDPYKKYGFGRWAVCDKQTDNFIGFCGLKFHRDLGIVEIGYRFLKSRWNQGFATETAMACIDYAFNTLKLPSLYCHVWKANKASHRVAEKLGFTWYKNFIDHKQDASRYVLRNRQVSCKEITAAETYKVRHPILRKGSPISSCAFDNDELHSTFHLGIFFNNSLIGVATFLEQQHTLFSEERQVQLRGMAVLEDFQKKGYGELLLEKGEHCIQNKKGDRLWFNARKIAVSFYQRLGFEIIGNAFDLPIIGCHYIMTKNYTI